MLKSGELILKYFFKASVRPLPSLLSATGEQTFPQNTQQVPKYSQKYTQEYFNNTFKKFKNHGEKHSPIKFLKELQNSPQKHKTIHLLKTCFKNVDDQSG